MSVTLSLYEEPNLKDILVDFTLTCLLKETKNKTMVRHYASDYFMAKSRQQFIIEGEILEKMRLDEAQKETYEEIEEVAVKDEVEEVQAMKFIPATSNVYSFAIDSLPIYEKTIEERHNIEDAMDRWPTFMALSQDQRDQFINAVQIKQVSKGDVIIKQGTEGENFYLVEKGQYHIHITLHPDDEPVKSKDTYENKGCFGELALMFHNTKRAATIRAATRGILWVLDRDSFLSILSRAIYMKRKYFEDILIGSSFQHLDAYHRCLICDSFKTKRYNRGDIIYKQGSVSDGMHFLRTGSVSCTTLNRMTKKNVDLDLITPGKYFGELSLFMNKCRLFTCVALEDSITAFIPAVFYHIFVSEVWSELMKERVKRFREIIFTKMGQTLEFAWNCDKL